jgi:hypothetical protein
MPRHLLLPLPILAVCTLQLGAQKAPTSSCPHWLGEARDGVSRETAWASKGAETPSWFLDVGLGYSNVSIVGERLYTLGHDEEKKEDRLFCLDVATGREV